MDKPALDQFRRDYAVTGLTPNLISRFRDTIYTYYRSEGRRFPWRDTADPYRILVSEVMLQQTQTSRVVTKYNEFIEAFPDFYTLAAASLRDVLAAWQGLGYNRRAIALQKTADIIVSEHNSRLPQTVESLQKLPGIGPNTAGAVLAIAFNRPVAFIETNIRSVCHYFFHPEEPSVPESEYKKLVEATLDAAKPREWYYALYDYGAMLKSSGRKTDRPLSRQSRFEGSDRQVRGHVLRFLLDGHTATRPEIIKHLGGEEDRLDRILTGLEHEGFIAFNGNAYRLRDKNET